MSLPRSPYLLRINRQNMSAAAPVSYALTPGHLNPDDPIDRNDKLGRNIYNRAFEPLKVSFDR